MSRINLNYRHCDVELHEAVFYNHLCYPPIVSTTCSSGTEAAAAARDRNLPSEGPRSVCHGMGRDELFLRWEGMVKEAELPVPNTTSALEGALTIRCD